MIPDGLLFLKEAFHGYLSARDRISVDHASVVSPVGVHAGFPARFEGSTLFPDISTASNPPP